MSGPSDFPQFTLLPIEIRRKIWNYTLPGPRVMLVLRSENRPGEYITTAASYGGHHPVALHVNTESRAEAQMTLKPYFGAYWNLETDALYIEAIDYAQTSVTQLVEMRKKGVLKGFKHIAVDWTIWRWKVGTSTMEFYHSFRDGRFDSYEHPIKSIAGLPDLKTCTFIYTRHTLQESLVKPYCFWNIGPLDKENTLDEDWTIEYDKAKTEIPAHRAAEAEWEPELWDRPDLEITMGAIHNRERENLPLNKLYKPTELWEMDWFG